MGYQDFAEATADDPPDEPAGEALRLAEVNINPTTELATNYLNHFSEAIMLLEMLPNDRDFRDHFLRWRPMSYREHFAASGYEHRGAVIAAYDSADSRARACLDALTGIMTAVLEATRAALNTNLPAALGAALANEAAALKPLVACTGAAINGDAHVPGRATPQAAVDELMKA